MRRILKPMLFLIFIVPLSCSKDNKKKCWQIYDVAGNEAGIVCDKTEEEIAASFFNATCAYHEAGGEKFCWMVNGVFVKDKTVKGIEHYSRCYGNNATPVKTDCDYCGIWYSRYKRTYKPTSQVTFSSVKIEQLCGDTSKALYHGRQILIKDTPDSLVVLQISSNGSF